MAINSQTPIVAGDFKVIYQRKPLLGLLNWWVQIKEERIGNDIYIISDYPIENVYINNEKFIKPNK